MSSLFVYIQRRGSKVLTNDVKTMLDTQNVDIDYMQGSNFKPVSCIVLILITYNVKIFLPLKTRFEMFRKSTKEDAKVQISWEQH